MKFAAPMTIFRLSRPDVSFARLRASSGVNTPSFPSVMRQPASQPREAAIHPPARVKRSPPAGFKRQAENTHAHSPPKAHRRLGYEEDDAPIIGMGDHIPMFLMRSARSKTEKTPLDKGDRGKKTQAG